MLLRSCRALPSSILRSSPQAFLESFRYFPCSYPHVFPVHFSCGLHSITCFPSCSLCVHHVRSLVRSLVCFPKRLVWRTPCVFLARFHTLALFVPGVGGGCQNPIAQTKTEFSCLCQQNLFSCNYFGNAGFTDFQLFES